MPQTLSSMAQGNYTQKQRQMMDIIEQEFTSAGYPRSAAAAAIVNAIAESALNPAIAGDGGKSVGLFQLHERGGGKGMSVAQRQDPRLNTRRIIEETRRGQGIAFQRAISAGERDVGKLAGIFAYYVERPADQEGERDRRAIAARRIFPAQIRDFRPSTASTKPSRGSRGARRRSDNNEVILTAGAALLALVAVAAAAAAIRS